MLKTRQSSPESKDRWLKNNGHKRAEINWLYKLRRFFGITPDSFQEMYDKQNGTCAICHVPFVGFKEEPKERRVHIDHDHSSRWVRGLLCSLCNSGIGFFKDDIHVMQSAIDYIVENSTPTEFTFTQVPNPKIPYSDERRAAARQRMLGNRHNKYCKEE